MCMTTLEIDSSFSDNRNANPCMNGMRSAESERVRAQ